MKLDYTRDALLDEFSQKTLRDRYMLPDEKSPQEAFARAARAFADDNAHAQRIYNYASKQWFMYATPILSNGGTNKGLPISCFLNYVEDSREGITDIYTENAFLASLGGGIGTYWGDVRSNGTPTSNGSESTGVIPFIKVEDSLTLAFSQGNTRRGSAAVYMDVSHPEIEEFLDVRKTTGDANRRSINIHHGVGLTDKFMRIIRKGSQAKAAGLDYDDSWDLIDPHTKKVVKTVSARAIWIKILVNRMHMGEPYIIFNDTINDHLPDYQKKLGLKVRQSNLCTEITLPTDDSRTAVCCLSSINAERYDEWKHDELFIEDLVRFLDNVLDHFIDSAPPYLNKAVYSAMRERAIGIGLMGFHSYLQSKMIPIESSIAKSINIKMFQHIKEQAQEATEQLAFERGPCPDARDSNVMVRNSHLLAIAPNASSSIMCGNTSPGIEPFRANVFNQKTMSGTFMLKNRHLEKVLSDHEMNTDKVWNSIMANRGSIQHLDLPEHVKDVFKTAIEIDQRWLIEHAADRQKYICQAQSLNLFLPAEVDKTVLHGLHVYAWEKGVKSLYYLRSEAIKRSEDLSKEAVRYSYDFSAPLEEGCLACEG